jgi:hypothetical protein
MARIAFCNGSFLSQGQCPGTGAQSACTLTVADGGTPALQIDTAAATEAAPACVLVRVDPAA